MNIYLELTKLFNVGKLRAVLSSGQAAVLHRLAVMSKDGDWILREAAEEWSAVWPDVEKDMAGHSLVEAHKIIARRAKGLLPFRPGGDKSHG